MEKGSFYFCIGKLLYIKGIIIYRKENEVRKFEKWFRKHDVYTILNFVCIIIAMIVRTRIQHIFTNYNKKPTIYDYIQEPVISIKSSNTRDAKYVARPIFNSIKIGEDKKTTNSLRGYRKYKMTHSKSRMKDIEIIPQKEY